MLFSRCDRLTRFFFFSFWDAIPVIRACQTLKVMWWFATLRLARRKRGNGASDSFPLCFCSRVALAPLAGRGGEMISASFAPHLDRLGYEKVLMKW